MTKQTNETNSKSNIELAFMRLLIAVLKTSLLIMAVAAGIVTVAWGPQTLARHSKPGRVGRAAAAS